VNADAKQDFALAKTYYGVTAVARFEGRRCTIAFENSPRKRRHSTGAPFRSRQISQCRWL
jgi:hypothetical protein